MVQYRKNEDTELLEVFHEETQAYSSVVTLLQLVGGLKASLIPEQVAKIESIIGLLTEIQAMESVKLSAIIDQNNLAYSNYLKWNEIGLAQITDQNRVVLTNINAQILSLLDLLDELIRSQFLTDGDSSVELLSNIHQETSQLAIALANIKSVNDNLLVETRKVSQQSTLVEVKGIAQEIRERLPRNDQPVLVNPFARVVTTAGIIPANHKYCSISVRSGTITINSLNITDLVLEEGEEFLNEERIGQIYGGINYSPAGTAIIYYRM